MLQGASPSGKAALYSAVGPAAPAVIFSPDISPGRLRIPPASGVPDEVSGLAGFSRDPSGQLVRSRGKSVSRVDFGTVTQAGLASPPRNSPIPMQSPGESFR